MSRTGSDHGFIPSDETAPAEQLNHIGKRIAEPTVAHNITLPRATSEKHNAQLGTVPGMDALNDNIRLRLWGLDVTRPAPDTVSLKPQQAFISRSIGLPVAIASQVADRDVLQPRTPP